MRPLQTLANLLHAVREGDFSLRARLPREPGESETLDALGQVMLEINAIGETLREQRLGALEATALLHRVMEEVDVAVFAFDDRARLRLVEPRRTSACSAEPARPPAGPGRPGTWASPTLLEGRSAGRIVAQTFPGGFGRWEIRRSAFREQGLPHALLVHLGPHRDPARGGAAGLEAAAPGAGPRAEQLARADPLHGLHPGRAAHPPSPVRTTGRRTCASGLEVVGNRAEALSRFMAAYARLARLPPPELAPVDFPALIRRVAGLEARLPVYVERGPAVTLQGDADQLEQLLINLVRNAVDAALETRRRSGDRAGE